MRYAQDPDFRRGHPSLRRTSDPASAVAAPRYRNESPYPMAVARAPRLRDTSQPLLQSPRARPSAHNFQRKGPAMSEASVVVTIERLPSAVVFHVLPGELRKSEVDTICA